MIAVEIRLNGELKATCGSEYVRQLVAIMSARESPGSPAGIQYTVECTGVQPKTQRTEEVLQWLNVTIALGDEVSFKFVLTSEAQAPIDRQELPLRDVADR